MAGGGAGARHDDRTLTPPVSTRNAADAAPLAPVAKDRGYRLGFSSFYRYKGLRGTANRSGREA